MRLCIQLAIASVGLILGLQAWAMPQAPPLKEWLDPFHEGFAAELALTDREGPEYTARTLVLDSYYAWDSGFALQLEVPSEVADSRAGTQGYSLPTLAGNLTNEIQVQADYRLWGDLYDYVAVTMGAALPIASDDTLRPLTQTFYILGASAQIDWGLFRLNLAFNDYGTVPNIARNPVGETVYFDTSNIIQYQVKGTLFLSDRLGVYLAWNENSPRNSSVGAENPRLQGADIVIPKGTITRVRDVALGIETAPLKQKFVFQFFVADYEGWGADVASTPQWATGGAVRWLY